MEPYNESLPSCSANAPQVSLRSSHPAGARQDIALERVLRGRGSACRNRNKSMEIKWEDNRQRTKDPSKSSAHASRMVADSAGHPKKRISEDDLLDCGKSRLHSQGEHPHGLQEEKSKKRKHNDTSHRDKMVATSRLRMKISSDEEQREARMELPYAGGEMETTRQLSSCGIDKDYRLDLPTSGGDGSSIQEFSSNSESVPCQMQQSQAQGDENSTKTCESQSPTTKVKTRGRGKNRKRIPCVRVEKPYKRTILDNYRGPLEQLGLSDEALKKTTVKGLNKLISEKGLSDEDAAKIKLLKRTLKNRGYAQNTRRQQDTIITTLETMLKGEDEDFVKLLQLEELKTKEAKLYQSICSLAEKVNGKDELLPSGSQSPTSPVTEQATSAKSPPVIPLDYSKGQNYSGVDQPIEQSYDGTGLGQIYEVLPAENRDRAQSGRHWEQEPANPQNCYDPPLVAPMLVVSSQAMFVEPMANPARAEPSVFPSSPYQPVHTGRGEPSFQPASAADPSSIPLARIEPSFETSSQPARNKRAVQPTGMESLVPLARVEPSSHLSHAGIEPSLHLPRIEPSSHPARMEPSVRLARVEPTVQRSRTQNFDHAPGATVPEPLKESDTMDNPITPIVSSHTGPQQPPAQVVDLTRSVSHGFHAVVGSYLTPVTPVLRALPSSVAGTTAESAASLSLVIATCKGGGATALSSQPIASRVVDHNGYSNATVDQQQTSSLLVKNTSSPRPSKYVTTTLPPGQGWHPDQRVSVIGIDQEKSPRPVETLTPPPNPEVLLMPGTVWPPGSRQQEVTMVCDQQVMGLQHMVSQPVVLPSRSVPVQFVSSPLIPQGDPCFVQCGGPSLQQARGQPNKASHPVAAVYAQAPVVVASQVGDGRTSGQPVAGAEFKAGQSVPVSHQSWGPTVVTYPQYHSSQEAWSGTVINHAQPGGDYLPYDGGAARPYQPLPAVGGGQGGPAVGPGQSVTIVNHGSVLVDLRHGHNPAPLSVTRS